MPNQSWIKIRRDNGKVDYAPVSRSKFYPEQSAKQMAKRSSSGVQPEVHPVPEGLTLDQLYESPEDADDSSATSN